MCTRVSNKSQMGTKGIHEAQNKIQICHRRNNQVEHSNIPN